MNPPMPQQPVMSIPTILSHQSSFRGGIDVIEEAAISSTSALGAVVEDCPLTTKLAATSSRKVDNRFLPPDRNRLNQHRDSTDSPLLRKLSKQLSSVVVTLESSDDQQMKESISPMTNNFLNISFGNGGLWF